MIGFLLFCYLYKLFFVGGPDGCLRSSKSILLLGNFAEFCSMFLGPRPKLWSSEVVISLPLGVDSQALLLVAYFDGLFK